MFSYITERGCAKHGVHKRMKRDVSVTVTKESKVIGNLNTAQNQLSVRNKTMDIIAVTDSFHRFFSFQEKSGKKQIVGMRYFNVAP